MSNVLIISPEPWGGHFVSKHHYAIELTRRRHQVLFCGPPEVCDLHLEEVAPSLMIVHTPRVFPGLRFLYRPVRRFLEARWIEQLEALFGSKIDVVWLFENSRFFDLDFAGRRLKLYQQVDLNQNFNPEVAAATADLSIAISGPIEDRLRSFAKRLIRITHGCPETSIDEEKLKEVNHVFARNAKNVVLTGNLDIEYLDIPLLTRLVHTHPGVGFHFVGGFSEGRGLHESVGTSANTVFWGKQPSECLPSFLVRADVLLVAYLADEHPDQLANPHKIMEYLASGRCVLATRTLEYEDRPGLVEVATDRDEFLRRFSEIISHPSSWNSPELIARRQAFAADNTYSRQLDRIAEALGSMGKLIS